ncbi:hypothetical protein KOR34_24450 [Posidoniimonas corsicana]|uniref:Carboxymuconolactone decarboxylase family protein n=1 Tax=Posidoniimonas corsicana TaxID=1938618 RepID=A0A5C5VHL7_9BACT|nr:hypothetical protein [Posidoniimonas corsicana]TWT37493.1 hypothetical protein KOR34_24450 [Posidoniimonas corsicana]
MPTPEALHDEIRAFEQHYGYDAAYLHDLLDRSPAAFEVFLSARQMSSFRQALPADAYYTAAVTVMQRLDCGACLQLNLRMAIEQGVARELLDTLLDHPEDLPPVLSAVRQVALDVHQQRQPREEIVRTVEDAYGAAAYGELALCVTGTAMYPTLKRALRKEAACAIGRPEF